MVQIVLAALGRQYPNLLGKSENDWKLKKFQNFLQKQMYFKYPIAVAKAQAGCGLFYSGLPNNVSPQFHWKIASHYL